ncbi:hypothetical protein BJN34_21185 [Cupriavidus necator]|uniref:Uncharacterized protein n=2 Tax=Cupriavidus necator TaxID=106590 RepID=A0A1U9UVD0_CUPNE|nr:hypothetical protein BJN34_21185 [Cupriavidus necator]
MSSRPDARDASLRLGLLAGVLLPNEPRILHHAAEQSLTERYLLPALTELEACLLTVRAQVDPCLQRLQPVKLGKPYPLGQCLEISEAVQKRLRDVNQSSMSPYAAVGLRALRSFQRAGGTFRQVWGDLRGQYFQNAFQLGTLYVDVSNDTVVATKPKVEILPFAKARFIPIADFQHFSKVASCYWQGSIYPNHLLPRLAPHCPLIHVSTTGRVTLHDATDYMLAMTCARRFQPSEAVLREAPMSEDLFKSIVRALENSRHKLARSPEHGRQLALRHCRQYRTKRWHRSSRHTANVIQVVQEINLRLAQWHHGSSRPTAVQPKHSAIPKEASMSTIRIDSQDYNLDNLSAEAKAQLQSIQFVDQELARLQAQTAAMQTARNAYVSALMAALTVASDTIKFP